MENNITNAAPLVVNRGTQDLSTRLVPREAPAIPQHLPKFFLFTEKGPVDPQLVVGSDRETLFGSKTFDYREKYANHATVFANIANANANACMLQRLIPDDAGPESNIIVWMDVLATTVDLYERNADGSIKTDVSGDPITDGTTAGYRVKFVVTNHGTNESLADFGAAVQAVGDQVDPDTSDTSTKYPILEFKASSKGAWGNLSGIRISAPTVSSINSMPSKMMSTHKAYPYNLSLIRKPTANATGKIVETLFGEQNITFTLKEDVIDPLTDKEMYLDDIFLDAYQNLTDPLFSKIYGDFGAIAIYQSNIETLLTMFHAAEIPHIDSFSDFTSSVGDKHLFNIFSGVSSVNVPYHSYIFVDAVDAVSFNELTNVYAAGGSDGTIDDDTFNTLVVAEMARYVDRQDPVQEIAINVESIIYDSGFPLATKYALCQFIGVRKDTFVVLSTHTSGEAELTPSEEFSVATALHSRLSNTPESDYFGTPVMRGLIMGASAKLRNSQYKQPLPLSLEILIKACKYMGSGNGRWKNGFNFDSAPNSIVSSMYDINTVWTPATTRNRNWDIGLNWVQAYDRTSYYFPALKTVYADDTSVLNSFFTAMAIAELNKVANAAHREFSGTSSLTNQQLIQRVNDFIIARTQGRFDDRFVIRPKATFTDTDLLRGFSWTLPIEIYAPNMRTVMTTYVQAFRAEDLEA